MEYYLGIKVGKGLFCSPLRQDNSPTCSFYRNKSGELIFKDFGGTFYGNFISVVMEKYKVTYNKALKIIAEDFNLLSSVTQKTSYISNSTTKFSSEGPANIQAQIREFTKEELDWWSQFGITEKILKKYHVFPCKSVFLNGELFKTEYSDNYIFGYYGGKLDKLELWRIYFPKQDKFRFLTNWPAKKIQGLKQLAKTGKMCIITKSMKDVMCLRSLGLEAIAPNSETLFIADKVLEDLKTRFNHVVVFYDNDLAGISSMRKIKKRHKDLLFFYIPRKYNAKDASDFYKMYGPDKCMKLIKQSIINYKKKK